LSANSWTLKISWGNSNVSHKSPLSTCAVLSAAALSVAAPLGIAAPAQAQSFGSRRLPQNTLYIESNNPGSGQNSVIAYHRNSDGSLTAVPGMPFATGGAGFANPQAAPGPFDGQNIMAADPIGGAIFVPNGGSDTISALRTAPNGSLSPIPGSPFAIAGNTPEALGLSGRNLIVVNNASDPSQAASGVGPSYVSTVLDAFDRIQQVPGGSTPLAAGAVPTQALPLGLAPLVYTNEFGIGTLSSYFLDFFGHLHLIQTQSPPSGLGPALGQDVNPAAPFLYVGLPGAAQIGVYRLSLFHTSFVRSIADTGKAPCWVRVSKNGRYLYSDNTGSHSISVYDLSDPSNPVETQEVVLNKVAAVTFDFALSPDQRFMYVVEAGTSNQVHILSVNQTNGQLTETAASPVPLPVEQPLQPGQRVQGLLVF
jgi:DNA-binding beta-propeller fold protein YncE